MASKELLRKVWTWMEAKKWWLIPIAVVIVLFLLSLFGQRGMGSLVYRQF